MFGAGNSAGENLNESLISFHRKHERKSMERKITGVVLGLVLFLSLAQDVSAEKNWYIVFYGGAFADNDLADLLAFQESPNFDTHNRQFEDYKMTYLTVLAVGKEVARFGKYLGVELEGQIGNHFRYQEYMEFNGLLILRRLLFPWNDYINTSFALGDGFSYATEHPKIESAHIPARNDSENLLNYVLFELTFGLPSFPHWQLVGRIHHRSNVFGLIGDSKLGNEGSNFLCLGIKYIF